MSDESAAVDRAARATDYDVSEWLSLEPGEEVEWVGEPTKLRLVGTVVWGIVLIPVLLGLLVLLFVPASYIGIKHTDYVVTNRSLYVKQGVLSTNIESVDLDRIQNTEFTQSFWGKQLGFGTIEVSTAGSSGADISFSDVEDAREVRDRINRVQREFAGGDRRGSDGTGGGSVRETAGADQLDQLVAELRATREALERVEAKLREDRQRPANVGDHGGATGHEGAPPDRPSASDPGTTMEGSTDGDAGSGTAASRSTDGDDGRASERENPAGGQSGERGATESDDSRRT